MASTHARPSPHAGHEPPQSTSVSSPFIARSVQLGAGASLLDSLLAAPLVASAPIVPLPVLLSPVSLPVVVALLDSPTDPAVTLVLAEVAGPPVTHAVASEAENRPARNDTHS